MYTLYDFMTHVKGIEYLLSVASIGVFMVFWEVLKPKPFSKVVNEGKSDWQYLRKTGGIMKYAGKIAAAPFIGAMYVVLLPIGFSLMVLAEVVNLSVKGASVLMGKDMSFDWNPVEAYFTGRKRKQAEAGKDEKK